MKTPVAGRRWHNRASGSMLCPTARRGPHRPRAFGEALMKFWQIAVIVITLTLLSVLALRLMPPVFDLAQETGWGAVALFLFFICGAVVSAGVGYGVWRWGERKNV